VTLPEQGIAEYDEPRVIYRPDRGYTTSRPEADARAAKVSQAAANVAQAASAVRDAAVVASALARGIQDRKQG
jgi:hypothetical protein